MSDSSLAEFDAHWEALTRPSPRPAKTSVCPQTQRYYSYLTSIAYYILLPVFTVYWSIHWILVPSFPSWTFHRMLANRKAQLESNLGAFYLPTMDEERVRWNPAYLSPYGGLQTLEAYARAQSAEEVEIETVKLFPVAAVHRRGIGRGEWVKDELVPGFWLSPARASRARGKGDEPASQGEKVVLHLHGGGYFEGHPFWNKLALQIGRQLQVRVFSVNYRKPVLPHTAFPAPLLDALSAYLHLINELHFDQRNITVLGVSAGGHLTMMLSRYLDDLDLPHPGSLALVGPWLDFEMRQDSYDRNKQYDHSTTGVLGLALQASTRWYQPKVLEELFFSPARAKSRDWEYLSSAAASVYINVGTRERMLDESHIVAGAMKEAGVDVRVQLDGDGLHLSILSDERVGSLLADLREVVGV